MNSDNHPSQLADLLAMADAVDLGCGKSIQLSDEDGNEFIVLEK